MRGGDERRRKQCEERRREEEGNNVPHLLELEPVRDLDRADDRRVRQRRLGERRI